MKSLLSHLLSAVWLIVICSCSKDENDDFDLSSSNGKEFSFQYKGETYSDPRNGSPLLDGSSLFNGIIINNPDLFGGKIYFQISPTNCAYMVPDTIRDYSITFYTCEFLGEPADSALVYFYKYGSMDYTFSNCRYEKLKSNFGTYFEYAICTVKGMFSITLKNKKNEAITITNGSFVFEKVMK